MQSLNGIVCPGRFLRKLLGPVLGGWACLMAAGSFAAVSYQPAPASLPLPFREFRGAWVATVNNIDWPSKPGLPVSQQKAELLAILDMAQQLRLNAILFQVRPACDALYASKLEPWSEYLTGQMGRAPRPFYDPLEFAVEEAHRRGLELHAWFNPFRARHSSGRSPLASKHLSQTQPHLVRAYGRQLWLDPGERAAQDHALAVVRDVVRRYDIDGIHIDDYFYPYPEKDSGGSEIDFPDEATWTRYRRGGGSADRGEWRRQNVNTFVRRLYEAVRSQKPWIRVGISPFGIWRPGAPPSVRGLDAYEKLYADSRGWLAAGWMDYCAPQLYWSIDAPQQGYAALLQWWRAQNARGRHVWPGNSVHRAAEQPGELAAQIRLTRHQTEAPGNLLWSVKPLLQNKRGVSAELARTVYDQSALVPAFPWLDGQGPQKPSLSAEYTRGGWTFNWRPARGEATWLWLLQRKTGSVWQTEILPSGRHSRRFQIQDGFPAMMAVRAVDRCGNLSAPAILARTDR
jgi:uncharacterized lipoprotein YddW (UPF0748 family)